MKAHPLITAAICAAIWLPSFSTRAQVPPGPAPAAAPSAPLLNPDQLQELVGRVALYPDDLLGLVLAASTTPLDIVKGQRFLDKYEKDKTLKPDPTIPEPVLNLMTYPDVVVLMANDLDWTEALGKAVIAQQPDVLQAIQTFRRKAQTAGNLESDDKQKVVVQEDVVQIASAQPDVIYVPQYQPAAVVVQQAAPAVTYAPTAYPTYYRPLGTAATVTAGFVAGAATAYGLNWATGSVYNAAGPVQSAYWQDQRQDHANEARESWQDYGKGKQEDWQNYSKDAQSQRQQSASQNQEARQQTSTANQAQRQQSAQQSKQANQAQRQEAAQGQRSQTAGGAQAARTAPEGAQNWQAAGQNRQAGGQGGDKAGTANRSGNSAAGTRAAPQPSKDAAQFGGRQAGGGSTNSAFSGAGSGAQARSQSERGAQSTSSANRSGGGGGGRSAPSGGGRSGGGGRGR